MSKPNHNSLLLAGLILLLPPMTLGGCGPSPTPAVPGGDQAFVYGIAPVDSVDLLTLESFPVQIRALVKGNLPDGCTTIDQITQQRQGSTFTVTITTKRPADKMCTEALVPFEESIALDVAGLPAGTYTVAVNAVTATFTLDIDNMLKPTP
jgi:inhibitor of cysteine peptidase